MCWGIPGIVGNSTHNSHDNNLLIFLIYLVSFIKERSHNILEILAVNYKKRYLLLGITVRGWLSAVNHQPGHYHAVNMVKTGQGETGSAQSVIIPNYCSTC